MKAKQNLHTHTTYVDGKDTPEEMVLEAIKRGFDSIGFSEHSYLEYSTYPNQLTAEKMARYKEEVALLKQKYKDKIGIFCGLEYDFYSDIDTDGFDYLIGSVHYLDWGGVISTFDRGLDGTLDYIKNNFSGDSLAFARKYFETVSRLPERKKFDIVGHFDLISKNAELGSFIDTSDKKYLSYGFEAIHALRGKIPLFEVNVSAMARGYRRVPYPQIEFLKEFNRLGFGAVITSDCHDKSYLDLHFDEAEKLLLSAGFKSKFILTEKGFEEVALTEK